MFGSPEKAFQYGSGSTGVLLRPEVTLLKLLNRHLLGFEDDMAHVVVRPIMIDDSPFLFKPFSERCSRKGSEDGESRKFDIIFLNEFDRMFKDSWIIAIESEDERTVDADMMILDLFYQLR